MLSYTIFGESHGPAIGVTLTGVPPGLALDGDFIAAEMARRAPGNSPLATARKEADAPRILSGVFEGKTTGAPLCAVIENTNTRSGDYADLRACPRPAMGTTPGSWPPGGAWTTGGAGTSPAGSPRRWCLPGR